MSPESFADSSIPAGTIAPEPRPDVDPAAPAPGAGAATARPRPRVAAAPPQPVTPNPDAALPTTALVGAPIPAAGSAPASADQVILESLVGQVNGRPVFASEILEPNDDILRAKALEKKDRREFLTEATEIIGTQLRRVINDELVLAEARASLTPEQKQGVIFFLNKIQEDLVSQQRGSSVAADELARNEFGSSLRARAQDRLDQELVGFELRQRIEPRLQASWRQVQLEYEKNAAKYNPKPTAQYRLIVVSKKNPESAEQVRTDLAAGRPFVEIAESKLNLLSAAGGGRLPPVALTGEQSQKVVDNAKVNEAAKPLSAGQFAGPIDTGSDLQWIMLESLEQPPAVSLYDAQLDITFDLLRRRERTETIRYFERLYRRGNVSKIEDMERRLLIIANQRYPGPTGTAAQ